MTTVATTSNAVRLASAVHLVAGEIARTGLDIANIDACRYAVSLYSKAGASILVGLQAESVADARTMASLWPTMVERDLRDDGGNLYLCGDWPGTDICVQIYARDRD